MPPCSGEVFESLEACNRRLHGYALAECFDIVRKGGGTKAKKTHGLAKARGLTGAEIAVSELKKRETLARKSSIVTPRLEGDDESDEDDLFGNDDEDLLVYDTSPRHHTPIWES